ncbi:hypothetical protein [Nostoc sp. 106C]|uniref:hypothetical protein n=1 Tax=Nostoc sp. 106C TaxID=1932667 RepID=UPI000A3B6CAD|nr:hypothetical protein [Nostoc sp. 106C]OUL28784.1 hypothetical protein BV375_16840 [Nostoc sp. 106C]
MNLTLAQVFGTGASQTATTVTIQKSGLVGLTPNANNRAEEIFAAIIKTATQNFEGYLTDPSGNAVLSPNQMSVDYDNSVLYDVAGLHQWQTAIFNNKCRFTFLLDSYSTYAN